MTLRQNPVHRVTHKNARKCTQKHNTQWRLKRLYFDAWNVCLAEAGVFWHDWGGQLPAGVDKPRDLQSPASPAKTLILLWDGMWQTNQSVLFPRCTASAATLSGCEVPNPDSLYTLTASQEINPRSASEQTFDYIQHLTIGTWVIFTQKEFETMNK